MVAMVYMDLSKILDGRMVQKDLLRCYRYLYESRDRLELLPWSVGG